LLVSLLTACDRAGKWRVEGTLPCMCDVTAQVGGQCGGGGDFVSVTKSLSVSFSHEACEEDKLGWDFRTHNRLTIVWEVTT